MTDMGPWVIISKTDDKTLTRAVWNYGKMVGGLAVLTASVGILFGEVVTLKDRVRKLEKRDKDEKVRDFKNYLKLRIQVAELKDRVGKLEKEHGDTSAHADMDILFETEEAAEQVLSGMNDVLRHLGKVSVADMYHLAGKEPVYAHAMYGWVDLENAHVEKVQDGYVIRLPNAIRL